MRPAIVDSETPEMTERARTRWVRRGLPEFVVIVVGVLVALWVDRWAADRADLRAEDQYVRALIRDVQSDVVEFDSVAAWSRRREAHVSNVLAFLRGEADPHADSLLMAIEMSTWQLPFSLATYAIDELRSTGNLRLIRDAELRRAVAAYYKKMEASQVVLDNGRDRIWRRGEEIHPRVLTPSDRLLGARLAGRMSLAPDLSLPEGYAAPSTDELRRRLGATQDAQAAFGDILVISRINRDVVAQMRLVATEFFADLSSLDR